MSVAVLFYLLILLVAAFIGGALLKSVKQPPVVGYLLAGLTINLLLGDAAGSETIGFLAEVGVVLLLFTLGLEFSLSRLKKVGRIALYGGVGQILATMILATILVSQFGFDFYPSFFMAAAFSLSSTAVVVKILTDKGELDTLPGEILVGWLIVQDLAALPMLILLPTLGKELGQGNFSSQAIFDLFKSLSFAILILGLVMILSKKLVPYIIDKVASLNSRELLLVSVFGIAVAFGLLTQMLGLSAAIGAFLVGLLIAESTQTHAVFSEIRPLRDIFGLVFFTSLGLVVPQGFFFSNLGLILGLALGVMILKFIIVLVLTAVLGYHAKTSFIVGVGLIEVGEFAFILGRTGLTSGVIDIQVYATILSVALISIVVLPPLFMGAPAMYIKLRDFSKQRFNPLYLKFFTGLEHKDTLVELPYKDHVVLCGYGRVGKYIGRALEMAEVPYVVVEYNHHKAEMLRKQGDEVVYGDPADIDILDYAQVDKARAVVIAIPDLHTQQMVVTNSLTLNKDVKIYSRTHHENEQNILKDLGVTAVIQPEFEASISITERILKLFGQKTEEIEGKISRLKIEHGLG